MIAIHSVSSIWKMTQKLFSQVQQSRVGNALGQRTFMRRLVVTSGPDVDHPLFDATFPVGTKWARYQGGKMQYASVAHRTEGATDPVIAAMASATYSSRAGSSLVTQRCRGGRATGLLRAQHAIHHEPRHAAVARTERPKPYSCRLRGKPSPLTLNRFRKPMRGEVSSE